MKVILVHIYSYFKNFTQTFIQLS